MDSVRLESEVSSSKRVDISLHQDKVTCTADIISSVQSVSEHKKKGLGKYIIDTPLNAVILCLTVSTQFRIYVSIRQAFKIV